jgi:hypothetical protein
MAEAQVEVVRLQQEIEEMKKIMEKVMETTNITANQRRDEMRRDEPRRHDEDMNVDLEDDEEVIPNWGLVLPPKLSVPVAPDASALASMLVSPPPLEDLRSHSTGQTSYTGVPQTPAPRLHRIDRQLYNAQAKMERTMHSIVHFLETGDKSALGMAAAQTRSAWEDLLQQRRGLIAGKGGQRILDPRPDDIRPRLLSKEEEQKMDKKQITSSSRTTGRGRPSWAAKTPENWRSRSTSPKRTLEGEKDLVKGRAETHKSDGAQPPGNPARRLGEISLGKIFLPKSSNPELPKIHQPLHLCLQANQDLPQIQFLGPRNNLQQWSDLGASQVLLAAIAKGVRAPITQIPPPTIRLPPVDPQQAQPVIDEYLEIGAIRKLTQAETTRTQNWVPIFLRPKKDGGVRLITDLRELNKCTETPHHKVETWNSVLETLKDRENQWGITLDLKGYFHHLMVESHTQRWMRFKVGQQGYQILAMPFGWSLSPIWAHKLAQPIRAWLNERRWAHCWWVDDILLLGPTREEVERRASSLVSLLTNLGVRVNPKKSMMEASQNLSYVGHLLSLENNCVSPLPEKTAATEKMVQKISKSTKFIPRHLAALAGNLGDANKSNACLHGLHQQLMREAALGVSANAQKFGRANYHRCWGSSVEKSRVLPSLLKHIAHSLRKPIARIFRPSNSRQYTITTDASDTGWGAQLLESKTEIGTCADIWEPHEKTLHITHREALASAKGVQILASRMDPGSALHIQTDATSTAWAWRKGSRKPGMNTQISQTLCLLQRRRIYVTSAHISGLSNRRADWLSRNPDNKNYQLDRTWFLKICQRLKIFPTVDLFASARNKQIPKYCSWRIDPKSLGNAWQLNWGGQVN